MTEKKQEPRFEEALGRLEEIVRHLERGDLPLDDSLALYEEGTSLIKTCSKMLDEAEQKVVKLAKGADGAPSFHLFYHRANGQSSGFCVFSPKNRFFPFTY